MAASIRSDVVIPGFAEPYAAACSLMAMCSAMERASRMIDERLADRLDGGVWIARAAHLRYFTVIARSWAHELPMIEIDEAADELVGALSAEEARALRHKNSLLLAALADVERTLQTFRTSL